MGNEYILTADGELYHWGIKGMRWGVRRYQRKDGSLTKAGQKRYADEKEKLKAREKAIKSHERTKAKFDKLQAKKAELDEREEALKRPSKSKTHAKPTSTNPAQRSFKDMTDDELREYTNRMNLEKNYLDAQRNLASLNPQKVSAGKKFATSMLNDVVAPAAKNVGKTWLENTLKDKLGLNTEDPVARVRKQWEKLDYEKKIEKLKKGDPNDINWDNKTKEQNYIKNQLSTAKAQEEYEEYLRKKRTEQGED